MVNIDKNESWLDRFGFGQEKRSGLVFVRTALKSPRRSRESVHDSLRSNFPRDQFKDRLAMFKSWFRREGRIKRKMQMDEIRVNRGERRAREEEVVGWCMLDAFHLSPVQRWRKSTFVRPASVLFGSTRYCHRGSQWGYTFPTTLEIGKALENEEWGIGAKVRRKVQLLVNHRGEWLRVIDDSHDRRACSVSRSVRGTRELVHIDIALPTTVRDVQRKSKHGNACY